MVYDSDTAHHVALEQAHNIGFDGCIDFGKADKVELLEKLALSRINLATMQGHDRNIALKYPDVKSYSLH